MHCFPSSETENAKDDKEWNNPRNTLQVLVWLRCPEEKFARNDFTRIVQKP